MTVVYYTNILDKSKQAKEDTIDDLLRNLNKQQTCYESLRNAQVRRLYFDIDVKNTSLFNDNDIKYMAETIFEALTKTKTEYIYGGYTTCRKIRYTYNLKYIPEAEKALSIHIVFPTIYIDKDKFDRFLDDFSICCRYEKQFIFDQFVYGNHDKMRHPLYNKGDVQNACNELVYVKPKYDNDDNDKKPYFNGIIGVELIGQGYKSYFNRKDIYTNEFIFKDSFITTLPKDVMLATDKQLEKIIQPFYIPEMKDEFQKAICYRLLTPSIDILNPIKRVRLSTKRISKVLKDVNLNIIGNDEVKNKLEKLKELCQQIEKLEFE